MGPVDVFSIRVYLYIGIKKKPGGSIVVILETRALFRFVSAHSRPMDRGHVDASHLQRRNKEILIKKKKKERNPKKLGTKKK